MLFLFFFAMFRVHKHIYSIEVTARTAYEYSVGTQFMTVLRKETSRCRHAIEQACCSAKYKKRDDRKLNLVALFDILAKDYSFENAAIKNVTIPIICFENAQPIKYYSLPDYIFGILETIYKNIMKIFKKKYENYILDLPKQVGQHCPGRGGRGLSHGV